jgi:hypothetical protein
MPGYDRTGPFGEGPLSGGGFGDCSDPQRRQPLPADERRDTVAGRGRGRGRGCGGGRQRAGRGAGAQPGTGRRRSGGTPARKIDRQTP